MALNPPTGSGTADRLDLLAHEELLKASDERVKSARGQAEKWIGGITALTGLLGIVYVVKGPESVSDIDDLWKGVIAASFLLALLFLASATGRAYKAAFGDATNPESTSPSPIDGVFMRLFDARVVAEKEARGKLGSAVFRAFVGIILAALALTATWFAPTTSSSDHYTCIFDANNQEVARFPGKTLEVTSTGQGVSVKACT